VGINLGDPIYRGVYHCKKAHEDDLDGVLERAVEAGCVKMMVTGSDLKESKHALKLAEEHREWSLSTWELWDA
jgi:TatD DNase family protein